MKYLFVISFLLSSAVVSAQVNYEVFALKYAILKDPTPVSNWAANAPAEDSVPISFHFWLLKGSQGKKILVDAGCRMDLQNAVDFGLTEYERPDSVLLRLGIAAREITDIIISHPHWDHIDGLPLFPEAVVWMQKKDYSYYVTEAWQGESKPGGIAPRTIEYLLKLNMDGRLKLVEGDNKEIISGVTVYTGSRHTFDSQYVLVNSGKERVVIASDNIWIYYNLQKMQPPPSYGTMDAAGYVRNMQRMKTQATKPELILPGHDDAMFRLFPGVNKRIIRIL